MPAHKHAEAIKAWADGAQIQSKKWNCDEWVDCIPQWVEEREYRVKPVPLCQIEGRDVFPGDKLWHRTAEIWLIASGASPLAGHIRCGADGAADISHLSWTEPQKTKTVYQWANLFESGYWIGSDYFHETEADFRASNALDDSVPVKRLDWTALEVPA